MVIDFGRRQFIFVLGGAIAWPLAARAQQAERTRQVGVLVPLAEDDPDMKADLVGFREGLARLGWSEGRNISIDARFGGGNSERIKIFAKELVALKPDVILAQSTSVAATLQQETRAIPIVFVNVSDPIGSGFIASLARPGGKKVSSANGSRCSRKLRRTLPEPLSSQIRRRPRSSTSSARPNQ